MQVVVDGLLTNYETRGVGKTVLLLHGWADSAKGLAGLQKALAGEYRVVAVDLPGFGGTQAPTGLWGLDDYVQFIAQFLQKIDERNVTLIVGHSNGGAMAIRGLASGLLHANKLVLLASAGVRGAHKGRIRAIQLVTKAGKALTMPLPKSVKQRLRKQVYQAVGSDMLVAEHLQETFKKVVADDVRTDAAKLTLPTLLIYGDQDVDTPVQYGEAFHTAIKGSKLIVLADTGHFVHIDRLDDVVAAIKEFAT